MIIISNKMVFLPSNSKVKMSFKQGDIGSSVPVDVGSCVSVFEYNSYSGLEFAFNQNIQNLPFQVNTNRPEEQSIVVCGSIAIGVAQAGSNLGYITFETLHDLRGPNGISQISPQVVVRDHNGEPLAQPYKPKELHYFDLNKGIIILEISLNGSKLLCQKIDNLIK